MTTENLPRFGLGVFQGGPGPFRFRLSPLFMLDKRLIQPGCHPTRLFLQHLVVGEDLELVRLAAPARAAARRAGVLGDDKLLAPEALTERRSRISWKGFPKRACSLGDLEE